MVAIAAQLDGTDETATIQAQIDAAPDGTPDCSTIIRFPEGRYHTEGDLANNPRGRNGVLLFENRHNLIVEGPATFYTEAPAVPYDTSVPGNTYSLRRHFWLKNCSNITIRNIRVEGSNYTEGRKLAAGTPPFWQGGPDNGSAAGFPGYRGSWEFEHAFDITDSKNITIEDCEVDSVWGDGVYIGNHPSVGSDNIILRNLNLRFTGRQGIGASNCRNVLIENVTVDHGRRAAIDLEPFSDNSFVTDVEIKNCNMHPLQSHFAMGGRGDVSRINIHDNIVNGAGLTLHCFDSAGLTRRSDWTFTNNIRLSNYGSPLAPIRFTMTDNVTIDNNTVPVVATQSRRCVTFDDCQGDLIVTNNNFVNGCYIDEIDSAPVIKTGNIFGATCPEEVTPSLS